jgi:hypothetical protein
VFEPGISEWLGERASHFSFFILTLEDSVSHKPKVSIKVLVEAESEGKKIGRMTAMNTKKKHSRNRQPSRPATEALRELVRAWQGNDEGRRRGGGGGM